MYDKILAIGSMLLFGVFLLILALWVEEAPVLPVVLAITFIMAAYDFWCDAFRNSGRNSGDKDSK